MENVVLVNPQEFGIEESKATELVGNLPQIQSERNVLEHQYNEILKMDIENPETSKVAREIRLKIRDNRTKGLQVWHKTTKDVFLRAGQYLDAIKRREEAVNERMESTLEEIEMHAINKERERLEILKESRILELQPFSEFVPFGINLAVLSESDYNNILNGAKLQLKAKIESERLEAERLEQERIETEKRIAEEKRIEAERIEEQRIENELLKAKAEKARIEAEKLEIQRQAELKRLADIQAKKDAEQAEILRIEREKQAKLEAELKAKKDAELKAEEQKIEAERIAKLEAEKLAKAPIKNQMKVWISSFELSTTNLENEVVTEIKEKFEAFKKWSESQIIKF
jgi:hypothetical protein